jgi:hypothetical protein
MSTTLQNEKLVSTMSTPMEFIERIDMRKLQYLNSLSYDEFKAMTSNSSKNEEERKKHFSTLRIFCKTNLANNGVTKRIYSYSSDTPVEFGGRLYSGNSIQSLPREIRGFLASETTDVDMKNAHPKLLEYICKQESILFPNLEYYNNHRDEILAKFPDADKAKKLFLKSVNDCRPLTDVKDKFLKAFDKEMKAIQATLTNSPKYAKIRESVPKDKQEKNWNGSTINRILCMAENNVLQAAIEATHKRDIEICTLMFDGFMVYGHEFNDEYLDYLYDEVEKKFPGLGMKWSFKPHQTTIKIPDDFDPANTLDVDDCVSSDLEAAQKVFKLFPHWVFCNGVLYVYNQDTWMWDNTHTAYIAIIMSLSDRLYVSKTNKDGSTYVTKTSYGNTLSLMEKLPTLIKTMCRNDDWLKQGQYTSLGKVLFLNGYFDMRTHTWYGKDDTAIDPSIVFMGRIHHNFEQFNDEDLAYMQSIRERLFYNVLGEKVGDYLIRTLARGLAGDMQKRMLCGLGETNSGKSILTRAVMLSCGDYADSFNAENLAYRSTSQDEAQQMRWAMKLWWKRIIFSNEIKSTVEINGNMIKKIASGGDSLVGRMHCGVETSFITHFLPVVLANDLPKIKPYDSAVDSRLRVVGYKKTFVDNPSNEFELKKDDKLDAELKTLRFQRCFVGILIWEYYQFMLNGEVEDPAEVIAAKKDWVGDDSNYLQQFRNEFDITNNKDDFISSARIEEWIKSNNLGITMKKFGLDITKECKLKSYDEVKTSIKSIGGKKVRGWFGLKELSDSEN